MAPLPQSGQVLQAIDIYLRTAFNGELPARVRTQMQAIENRPVELLSCSAFTHDPHATPIRYYLRLGNAFYPHMKLAVELPPNADHFVYRVDTHDRHCCPARGAREYDEFCKLMEKNQTLAGRIEAAWEAAGLPTFKSFLRDDLKRRQAAAKA